MNFSDWISTMTVHEVADTVLAYFKVLTWPLIIVTVLLIFRKEVGGLLDRVNGVQGGPLKVSFRDVAGTVAAAAAADADATRQQKEAADQIQGPVGSESGQNSEEEAPESSSPSHINKDAAPKSTLRELLDNDAAAWEPMKWRIRTGFLREVESAWRELERVTADTVNSFDFRAADPYFRDHPGDPVAFFLYMHRNYGGSRKAFEAARSARQLRKQVSAGVVIDRDEAEALTGAINDLTSSARKYATMLAGQRLGKRILEKIGSETLPTDDPI